MTDCEDLIASASGSLALEGMEVPEEIKELARMMHRGEITREEAVNIIIARYTQEQR